MRDLTLSSCHWVGVENMEIIQKHCRHLRRISIRNVPFEATSGLANHLALYGDQLEFAVISSLNQMQLDQMVRSCTKARFFFHSTVSHGILASLRIMGRQLEGIVIKHEHRGILSEESISAWNLSVNLRFIEFHRCSVEEIEAVFYTPKPLMKKFFVRPFATAPRMTEIIDIFTQVGCSLEEITVEHSWYNSGGLGNYFELNKSSLSRVVLR